MLLQNKYKIGTLVMFYELDAIKDFVSSIISACEDIENKNNITVEFILNVSEYSEKIDTSITSKEKLIELFKYNCIDPLIKLGFDLSYNVYDRDDKLYSIGSYRRDLNYFNCNEYDFIVWGESDCMMPKQYFEILEQVSLYAKNSNINRYCLTFSVRKMWDSSWAPLEHIKFENETFLESTDERCSTMKSSIWYYMSQNEMNEINNEVNDYDIRIINHPRFDGSLLTISKDLLLNGINIPPAVAGTGEDTAFQQMITTIMGNEYKQFIIKNILKVHNRNHPNKRNYILGENSMDNVRKRRSSNQLFESIHKSSNYNLSIIGPNQNKFKQL